MATANPTLEDVELNEDQRLLGEEADARHSSIIKNNYKEPKVKHQEEKGEKEKKKRDESQSDRSDENRIDQV